jgi:hypothetical protein
MDVWSAEGIIFENGFADPYLPRVFSPCGLLQEWMFKENLPWKDLPKGARRRIH